MRELLDFITGAMRRLAPRLRILFDRVLLDAGFARDLRAWLDRTVLLFADRLLPFEAEDARLWGQLSARIGHGGADLMIAATALRHGAVVVTGNVDDFAPTGVRVENPF